MVDSTPEKKEEKKDDDSKMSDVDEQKKAGGGEQKEGGADSKKQPAKTEKEMSEEDKRLKENLELLLTVITEPPAATAPTHQQSTLQRQSLTQLQHEIKSSTSSMTSIPKPLKFLKPHYARLAAYHAAMADDNANKGFLADTLSVLAMTQGGAGGRETLRYKLLGEKAVAVGEWGHEYVRHLAGEIGKEYTVREEEGKSRPFADLDALVSEIVPFFMEHNAEYDAVDMLIEVEQLPLIADFLRSDTHRTHVRVCLYILKCAEYIIDGEEQQSFFAITFQVYLSHDEYAEALRVAIRMQSEQKMEEALRAAEAKDLTIAKQLAYILGAHRIALESYREHSELADIMGNAQLSAQFHQLAAELDVKEAKTPEDIYKSHLEEGGTGRRPVPRAGATASTGVDSAKQNLASSFVNAFLNVGFGKDLLVTPQGSDWLYKNKSHGQLSATASLGLIMLWDLESGFSEVDKYSFAAQAPIKAGTAMAHGMLSSGVTSDMDAALALLTDQLESKDVDMRLAAIFGLGLSYCNSARSDVLELLVPLIVDESQPMEVVAHACLSLGLVYCGTASEDISGSIIEAFLDRSDTDLRDSTARLMALGMGLLFLNRGADVEPALTALKVLEHPINKYLELTVSTCAYAGIASPLEIQKLLAVLLEHVEEDEADRLKGAHQEVAVLGIAMLSLSEEATQEMALRSLDHILQYAEVNVRRVVPLALGLLSISNPRLTVQDTLSKLSHDQDQTVSQNAVFAMGLIGAGTNHSRIAATLRSLASYYSKEPNHLFLVRIAQGLLHLGKGLMTLSPLLSDGLTMSRAAMAGLLVLFHAAADMQHTVLGKRHYLLYAIAPAIRPRMLMTINEAGESIAVQVRVGQRVDTVGQAGKPKTITGFQTHKTPVLISAGERAELADDEYIPLTSVLEGVVIVKKNPDFRSSA